jgi:arsenate reductase
MAITIYHNPNCSTSRDTVRFCKDAGFDPVIIEYLQSGWTKELIQQLSSALDKTPFEMLRPNAQADMKKQSPQPTDAEIIESMIADPILVERPIVVTPRGTYLCRPLSNVTDILDAFPKSPWMSEKGVEII